MRKQIAMGLLTCALLSTAASALAQTRVYRCISRGGDTEFRQHPCPADAREQELLVEHPDTGWVAPAPVPDATPRKGTRGGRKGPARASGKKPAASDRCWRKRRQLADVNWQLRRGYKAGKGVKLRRRRDDYEAYLDRYCRD
jgi:hypothetical protein